MRKKQIAILLTIIAVLLITGHALSMSSTNYRLDWFTSLTGGGGGEASSAHYVINFTVGQSVIGESSSKNYGTGLGYWYGVLQEWFIHLPIVMK